MENCKANLILDRSSYWRCSVRKDVFRNFAKFTGKHLCQSLFFNKVAGPRPGTLLEKRIWCKFCKISKNKCFTDYPRATASAHFSRYYNYLIWSTLLGILYVLNTIYKVLLKVINERLLLLLESSLSCY